MWNTRLQSSSRSWSHCNGAMGRLAIGPTRLHWRTWLVVLARAGTLTSNLSGEFVERREREE